MKVWDGQQICLAGPDPVFPLLTLTLRTMPVTTTVIADVQVTALITLINVSAQCSGTATPDGIESPPLPGVKLQLLISNIPMLAQYGSYFKSGPHVSDRKDGQADSSAAVRMV